MKKRSLITSLDRAARTFILGLEPDINRSELAKRVRNGRAISPNERNLIADLIDGRTKRPRNRPKTTEAALRQDEIAQRCIYAQVAHPEWQQKRIIADIAKYYGVSQRHVLRLLQRLDPERRKNIEAGAEALAASNVRVDLK